LETNLEKDVEQSGQVCLGLEAYAS